MKHRRIFVIMLMLSLVLAASGSAFAGIPEPTASFYVADYADVITQETEQHIIEKNAELEYYCDGAQIVVVTVDFLDGMDIEDYCYKLFNDWQIGSTSNNGVLLLLTIGEENYWCMVGKGLEGELTAGDLDDLLWIYLEDSFAAEMYDFGVKETFDQLANEMYNIYDVHIYSDGSASTDVYDEEMTFLDWVIGLIVLIAPFVIIFFVTRAIVRWIRRNFAAYTPTSGPVVYRTRRPRRIYVPTPVHRPHRPYHPSKPPHRPHHHHDPFGSGSFGSRPSRPSASRPSASRPSRPSGGISRGGGGISRGGGAGRRGR